MSDVSRMTNQPKFRERLWPNIYVWLFAILMLAAIAIAAGNVYGYDAAAVLFIASVGFLIAAVIVTTTTIEVSAVGLRAGRAVLPLECIGQIRLLDRQQTMRARAQDAHADAFFTIRSWIPQSLIIVVTDESDPHPYWHISSRNSQQLKDALESLKIH